ncbi:MAG: DUF4352 domain-containing protein [Atopobiaceae bacterium]|nr:DUF4352 domain-containing protein [Atopobiaceae bacterium]
MRKQKMIRRSLITSTLLTALLLAGCGGSSASQDNAAGADQASEETAAQEVSAADAEAALSGSGLSVGDEPGLTNEDVAGIYLLDSEIENDALFTVYQLKKNGTFVLRGYAAGESTERTGTYDIRDGKVYINLPEAGSGTLRIQGQDLDYTAPAWEDVETTIEDGKLTIPADGKRNEITGRKITREEYQQLVAKAAEAGPKHISVGETVSGDGYTFTVNSFEFRDEIYPSDTSGYYTYWSHEDDHDYLVADITYTNDGTEYQSPAASTAALFSIAGNNYNPTIEVDGGSRMSRTYTIDPKDTGRVIISASIPDAAREEIGEVSLVWVFPKDPELLSYYFSNDNESVRYILTL